MTSKTSCFNSGLMRRSLLKGAPLWGLWLLFWLLLLPVYLLTRQDLVPFELTRYLFDCLVVAGTFGVFFYGLVVAWFQFAWLYRTRSAYHYASLPIRRETQFVSRYLAGASLPPGTCPGGHLAHHGRRRCQGRECGASGADLFGVFHADVPLLL